MYIVIEGQDATGKSTQVEMLADYFKKQGLARVLRQENLTPLSLAENIKKLYEERFIIEASFRKNPVKNATPEIAAILAEYR